MMQFLTSCFFFSPYGQNIKEKNIWCLFLKEYSLLFSVFNRGHTFAFAQFIRSQQIEIRTSKSMHNHFTAATHSIRDWKQMDPINIYFRFCIYLPVATNRPLPPAEREFNRRFISFFFVTIAVSFAEKCVSCDCSRYMSLGI